MNTLHAAIAALGLLSVPAMAAGTPEKREAVAVRVSTQGLDLNTRDGVGKLRARMARAIAAACQPSDRLYTGSQPDWRCRAELGDDASVKLSALTNQSSRRIASR